MKEHVSIKCIRMSKSQFCISTENHLFIKKAYRRLLIDYEAGGMHAKFIHSTKAAAAAALIDYRITWRKNVTRRE